MKVDIGEYIRTRKGKIAKIIKAKRVYPSPNVYTYVWELDDKTLISMSTSKIVKHSHDITDLIEVGDYVNGYKVLGTNLKLKWWDDELGEQDETEGIELESYGYIYPNSNYYFELKSIVTKEQFEAMQYKVV